MPDPERTVRARLAEESTTRERAERSQLESEVSGYARLIGDAVPRILEGLEARHWPDGQMVSFREMMPQPRVFGFEVPERFYATRWLERERAAWVIDRPLTSVDFSYTVFLLSDGRLLQSGQRVGWGPTPLGEILGRAATATQADLLRSLWTGKAAWQGQEGTSGLRALVARYCDSS